VTDRDITVRSLAEGKNPSEMKIGDLCSHELTAIAPSASVEDAVRIMREKAVRRLPVLADNRAVGIVSIGDLAREQDPRSALADISGAAPNN